ncbi:ergothioneine biosynthesis protein EgtB [Pontibacter sp. E15-1]|uniref:ergothioneine biosynthesis protein EgtB n=1 Tax=Pontibacter sp. E15-1 TaxID=2919918 RepID=UPI001F4FFA69|nr:ergothioneine biosynthesis protein EgtB [Pontibacter sp. E15-1]MCJ8167645.1 ergothioneine biosynthesis protein EgtB [Pontibacter sp. E15-1]
MNAPLTAPATQEALQQYAHIRAHTETICQPLEPEDTVVQPIVDVSPPKWHMAHTSWFFETFLLQPHLPGYKVFHEQYSYLFNSYYNSVGSRVQRDQRSTLTRPPLRDIYAYRQHVDEHMQQLFQRLDEDTLTELLPLIQLGLQHEQQHQELLVTDIKYILSTNPMLPVYKPQQKEETTQATKAEFIPIPGGVYTIGFRDEGFSFDNEFGVHEVLLDDFQIMNRLVTNGEYLAFMQDGGYRDFRHWLDEGFAMVNAQNLEAPLYWVKQEDGWHRFTMHGLEKVNLNDPVCHISFYEADAYANWAGKRLLTEFEWEAASQVYPPKGGNFVESGLLEPRAADPTIEGLQQMYGDVWEWTYSAYHPYPGFTKAPGAIGEYNGKFMLNQMVLRGGSCATSKSHIRTTYRNFFHPDKRWQYNGIRLAQK